MKKKIVIKGILCLICMVVCVYLFNFLIQLRVNYALSLTTTYVAAKDLMPRTLIRDEDLIEVRIAKDYVMDHTLKKKEDIVGKYTTIQGLIPAGSPIYERMVEKKTNIKDHPVTMLLDDQADFVMETDVAKLGSVIAGQRVNIHLTINNRDGNTMTGMLIENARVLIVKDHQGMDVTNEESTGIPYFVELAVNQNDIELLTLAMR